MLAPGLLWSTTPHDGKSRCALVTASGSFFRGWYSSVSGYRRRIACGVHTQGLQQFPLAWMATHKTNLAKTGLVVASGALPRELGLVAIDADREQAQGLWWVSCSRHPPHLPAFCKVRTHRTPTTPHLLPSQPEDVQEAVLSRPLETSFPHGGTRQHVARGATRGSNDGRQKT